jgi:hypothetical protein
VAPTAPPSDFDEREVLGAAEAASAGDDHIRVLDRRAFALLVRLLDHARLRREILELHLKRLHLGLTPALDGLERPGADQRKPRLAFPADVDVDGVVEGRPLADELAVLLDEVDDVPVEAGVEAGGETGGDVRGQNGCGEDDGVESLLLDQPREHVDARLRQRRLERGVVGNEDAARAEASRLLRKLGDAGARDHARHLAAELRRLAENAERILLQLVAVVLEEDQRLHSAFRSARNSTICSAAEPSSSIVRVSPRGGGGLTA